MEDYALLCELEAAVKKLMQAVKNTVPATAETIENRLIVYPPHYSSVAFNAIEPEIASFL